jgi:dihydroorotase (multifunctional complex type)
MADLLVKNGKIVTPSTIVEANLVVEDGKITKITKQKVDADGTVDAKGLYVIPGLIDTHVHLRDPGQTRKETWKTGSQAAAAGGVTTVLDMPNNKPSINTKKRLDDKRDIAAKKSIVDFGLYFGAENDNLDEIKKVKNVAGVKFFLGKSTGELLFDVTNLPEFLKVLKQQNLLAAFHCEKTALLEKYVKSKFKYFADIRPPICEAMSIRDVARSMHGGRIHICHVTSDMGIGEIVKAKKLNKNLTCEVTPQHLYLTKEDEREKGAYLKMYPPLKSKSDQASLWHALRGGIIDIVSTDHAPHLPDEKEKGFNKAPGGVPGVETRLPLVLDGSDMRGLVEMCSRKPAEIYGIKNKGVLAEGYDADFVLLDSKKEYTIKNDALFTKCGWSPFNGMKVRGKVEGTFVRGQQVYDGEGTIESEGREVQFA